MGLCGSSSLVVKGEISHNMTYDFNGIQLDNTLDNSQISYQKAYSIKAYSNLIFEFEIEACIGEIEYPIYITKDNNVEINIYENENYMWSFFPNGKMVDYKGYSKIQYNNLNLGCLLMRISGSKNYIHINKDKFKFKAKESGSLLISANLDFDKYLFYQPKGSLKIIIKGGELHEMKLIDKLMNYNSLKYYKQDDDVHSEINLRILRYINKARTNIKQYINDFIVNFDTNDEQYFNKKGLKSVKIDNKLYKISEEHCKYLCNNETSGHISTDGKYYDDECIVYGYNNAISIVNFMVINKFSKKKKERKILLNDKYSKIGIFLHEHCTYGYCCVILFGE